MFAPMYSAVGNGTGARHERITVPSEAAAFYRNEDRIRDTVRIRQCLRRRARRVHRCLYNDRGRRTPYHVHFDPSTAANFVILGSLVLLL